MNKSNPFILLLIIGLFACNSNENLDGHWHIECLDHEFKNTFDIVDSTIYLNKYFTQGWKGTERNIK